MNNYPSKMCKTSVNYLIKKALHLPNERKSTFTIDSIYDIKSKSFNTTVSSEANEQIFSNKEFEQFKKEWEMNINYHFLRLGKAVKSGDILGYFDFPNESYYEVLKNFNLKEIKDRKIKDKIPEIIKGWGLYKNKKVVVTEYTFEDDIRFSNSDNFIEFRMRGYYLYDPDLLLLFPVFGEGTGFFRAFLPKVGTIFLKVDFTVDSYDLQIKNTFYPGNFTHSQSLQKSTKESWSEAIEKIKALGELLEKGLITQEEYNDKKRILLDQF